MELSEIKGVNMPIHTLPPDVMTNVIQKGLMPFLVGLLGIDVTKNPLKLATVEKMIFECADRRTPSEIQKAFLSYSKGELQGLEPISGHLDSILFAKVINQYQKQRKVEHKPYKHEISDDEKKENEYLNIIYAYDEWKQDGATPLDYHWVYDSLKERGLLKVSKEEAKSLNKYLRENYPNFSREKKQKKGKVLLLDKFFSSLKVHIKQLL